MAKTLEQKLERLNEGVLCNFRIGFWGARAKYDSNKLGREVPKEIVRAVQDLLHDKTLIDDIKNVQWRAKYILKCNSLPFPIDSVFWIPKSKVVLLNEELEELTEEHDERVNKLVRAYPGLIKKFEKKFPKDYKAERYPDKEVIRDKFYIDYKFFNIGMPDSSAEVLDPSEYKRVVSKFRGMVDEMEDMSINIIGNDLLKRIDKLQGQCESGEGLHGKTVGSVNRFLEKWEDLWAGNIDDRKMKIIMSRLKREMKKVSIDRLKGNEEFREEVAGKLGNIMKGLESMPNVALKRKLDM